MALRARVRLILFVAYVVLFFGLPLSLLWGMPGFVVGATFAILFLLSLRVNGSRRISRRLKARPLTRAEAPAIHTVCAELSRRLGIPLPEVNVIESPALNAGIFGFNRPDCRLVLTRGLLNGVSREEIAALLARLLVTIPRGSVLTATWLGQFLASLDWASNPSRGRPASAPRRFYSFRLLFRQVLIYPMALIPGYLLSTIEPDVALDKKAATLCRNPNALAEALRHLEATKDRIPLVVSFGFRHLFVLPPPGTDALARMLFEPESLSSRIVRFEAFRKVVNPA